MPRWDMITKNKREKSYRNRKSYISSEQRINTNILSVVNNRKLARVLVRSPNGLRPITYSLETKKGMLLQSKKEGKDQESIQTSTSPDTGYQWESDNVTIRHHKREPRG